jgi:uncharacterized protein YlaI
MPKKEPKQVTEREAEADVIVIRLFCDVDNAQMQATGKQLLSNPPKFEYQCPTCKHRVISTKQYPLIVYKEKKIEA